MRDLVNAVLDRLPPFLCGYAAALLTLGVIAEACGFLRIG